MAESRDRRSASTNGTTPQLDEPDAIDRRADGSIRRPGKGGRTMTDFFAEGNLDRPMTRRDYVNMRASEEFSRTASTLVGRILRVLRGEPQVKDLNFAMGAAHERSLRQLQEQIADQVAAQEREFGRP
jgi:hypothetical protein